VGQALLMRIGDREVSITVPAGALPGTELTFQLFCSRERPSEQNQKWAKPFQMIIVTFKSRELTR